MGFHLTKWYLDCVNEAGDVFIGYVGHLEWGFLNLHYSSVLSTEKSQITQRNSLRERSLPLLDCSSICWNSAEFGVTGMWQPCGSEVRETVFEDSSGSVQWHCLMPRARVQIGNETGLGYAEHLTMTIAPWKIPIDRLQWGRFCNESDSIVWIDWRGEYSKRIVYVNGAPAAASAIDDRQIAFEDGSRLTMDHSLTLREGPLGSTALSSIPGVANTLPARLLQVNECKWRSRARFERPEHPAVEGWAIHEIVQWPK